ncbi:MAG: hypothetical protein ABEN55_00315 [Bradymonadaceae bacterium]
MSDDSEVKTNQSPGDARGILEDFKKDTIIEFVCQNFPDEVSVEKLSHAKFKTVKSDVTDTVDELKQQLKDVAHLHGTELDEKTERMLNQIGRAFEMTDEQIGEQLDLFQQSAGHAEKREASGDGDGETGDDVDPAAAGDGEVIDVNGEIDDSETVQELPPGDPELSDDEDDDTTDLERKLGDKLRKQCIDVLLDAGIETVSELLERFREGTVTDIPYVSDNRKENIWEALQEHDSEIDIVDVDFGDDDSTDDEGDSAASASG